jgi:hypothetical protein
MCWKRLDKPVCETGGSNPVRDHGSSFAHQKHHQEVKMKQKLVECVCQKTFKGGKVRFSTWLPMKKAKLHNMVKLKTIANDYMPGWRIIEINNKISIPAN